MFRCPISRYEYIDEMLSLIGAKPVPVSCQDINIRIGDVILFDPDVLSENQKLLKSGEHWRTVDATGDDVFSVCGSLDIYDKDSAMLDRDGNPITKGDKYIIRNPKKVDPYIGWSGDMDWLDKKVITLDVDVCIHNIEDDWFYTFEYVDDRFVDYTLRVDWLEKVTTEEEKSSDPSPDEYAKEGRGLGISDKIKSEALNKINGFVNDGQHSVEDGKLVVRDKTGIILFTQDLTKSELKHFESGGNLSCRLAKDGEPQIITCVSLPESASSKDQHDDKADTSRWWRGQQIGDLSRDTYSIDNSGVFGENFVRKDCIDASIPFLYDVSSSSLNTETTNNSTQKETEMHTPECMTSSRKIMTFDLMDNDPQLRPELALIASVELVVVSGNIGKAKETYLFNHGAGLVEKLKEHNEMRVKQPNKEARSKGFNQDANLLEIEFEDVDWVRRGA